MRAATPVTSPGRPRGCSPPSRPAAWSWTSADPQATRQPIEYRLVENGWEALAALAGIREGPRAHAPLAGRRTELALLAAALERVRETRAPALFTVVGPPGIGKSRLLAELDRQGARVLAGRSLPYGPGLSFWALGEMIKSLAGILESDSSPVAAGSSPRSWPTR